MEMQFLRRMAGSSLSKRPQNASLTIILLILQVGVLRKLSPEKMQVWILPEKPTEIGILRPVASIGSIVPTSKF